MKTDPNQLNLVKLSWPAARVALVELFRPEKRNALSSLLIQQLAQTLARAEELGATCVVLSGNDSVFSAGADIAEMRESGIGAISNQARMTAWGLIEQFSLPLIAAVRGVCFGGGHELAMLADIVIASSDARFGQPEIKLGIIPGDGATQRLIRLVGKPLAMKMILSGEPIDAQEALRFGLVAEVVEPADCVPRAVDLATKIASWSPVALRLAKDAVLASYETGLVEGLRTERRNIALAFTTHDQKEGMAAFFEKRAPKFVGL